MEAVSESVSLYVPPPKSEHAVGMELQALYTDDLSCLF